MPRAHANAPKQAVREADRAEAEAWSIRMEGYGGPAQASPTIAQCLNGGLGWLEVKCRRCNTRAERAARCDPPAAGYAADLEARGIAEVPVMSEGALHATGAHDQANRDARDTPYLWVHPDEVTAGIFLGQIG
jgi:hypothetical protein